MSEPRDGPQAALKQKEIKRNKRHKVERHGRAGCASGDPDALAARGRARRRRARTRGTEARAKLKALQAHRRCWPRASRTDAATAAREEPRVRARARCGTARSASRGLEARGKAAKRGRRRLQPCTAAASRRAGVSRRRLGTTTRLEGDAELRWARPTPPPRRSKLAAPRRRGPRWRWQGGQPPPPPHTSFRRSNGAARSARRGNADELKARSTEQLRNESACRARRMLNEAGALAPRRRAAAIAASRCHEAVAWAMRPFAAERGQPLAAT